jgi:hypothetical protein
MFTKALILFALVIVVVLTAASQTMAQDFLTSTSLPREAALRISGLTGLHVGMSNGTLLVSPIRLADSARAVDTREWTRAVFEECQYCEPDVA